MRKPLSASLCEKIEMKIRKQVYDLTLDDVKCYPVWQYALDEEGEDGQDEATVRPVPVEEMDLQHSSYIVRARFLLADGTTAIGTVTVSDLPDDGIIKIEGDNDGNAKRQPVIITSSGQIGFWFGSIKPKDKEIAEAYLALGCKSPGAVFPLTYRVDVQMPNCPAGGRIGGFQYLEDKTTRLEFIMKETR